ncbi:hypothetical protein [Marinobacter zhejiangensis]|uniref:Uncharacterized protein n=1 Tax=Marinobacter zhejiangensis TaxID=488535 RepID=A0A1I4P572_9GAMM|nr:hypothetical protein [Marinobacter zhejiangensis]SFM22889.1 hypothetical protein SAMN04487963_1813 [Marinobacter zhejiangensis]
MYNKTIELFPFGTLKAKGRSKVWQASVTIPHLGGDFDVVIRGTPEGPLASQTTAFSKLIEPNLAVCDEITNKVTAFINSCGIIPSNTTVDCSNVWSFITPELIEVHESNFYSLGEGELGTNVISIGYLTPWTEDQLIQVPFLNGEIGTIYSE